MTSQEWTPTNRELQQQICDLIGLDFQMCQQVTIKLTFHGTVEYEVLCRQIQTNRKEKLMPTEKKD